MVYETIIGVQDLKSKLGHSDWVIVDCRFSLAEPASGEIEYRQSHIPGSYYAHLDHDLSSPIIPGVTGRHPLPDPESIVSKIRTWGCNHRSQVVVYDHSIGGIASRLWWIFRWLGHEKVAVLDGGWNAWVGADMPVSSDMPLAKQGNFQMQRRDDLILNWQEINQIRNDPNWSLVDSREPNRYLGLEEPIDPVAGHIDGAVNYFFRNNVTEDGCWKSPDQIKKLLAEEAVGKNPEQTAFYCGSGVTACHNLLAYKHAGLGDALLYPGSWSEWINYYTDG